MPLGVMFNTARWHNAVLTAKRAWYGSRGEPIRYGSHRVRYIPGTRPVRLKYLDSRDAVVRNDAKQLAFLIYAIKPGNFVLDIGGNVGQYAVLFSSLVGPGGKVITFEPDNSHRCVLEENLRLNGFSNRARVETLALSDSKGTHSFFSRNDQMSSLARSGLGTNANSSDVKEQTVETVTLDEYLAACESPVPDLIKIDTEGAEINVLRGGRKTLASTPTIVCELHPYAWSEFGTSYEELLALLSDGGRRIRYLDDSLKIEHGAFHASVIID
jgi:FkbM family methyltransferase